MQQRFSSEEFAPVKLTVSKPKRLSHEEIEKIMPIRIDNEYINHENKSIIALLCYIDFIQIKLTKFIYPNTTNKYYLINRSLHSMIHLQSYISPKAI